MPLTLTDAGIRKAAILLVQLGQDHAAQVMAHLRESEVEAISAEISNLDSLGYQETEAVLDEFRDLASAHANVMRGGPAFARALLEESLGYERAEAIMNRLAASAMQLPFQFLHRADPAQLRASLALTAWLAHRFHIALRNVIGHAESLSSPFHRERYAPWRRQTHGDWSHADMERYRARLRPLLGG